MSGQRKRITMLAILACAEEVIAAAASAPRVIVTTLVRPMLAATIPSAHFCIGIAEC